MNKEEVLKLAQQNSKTDEREKQVTHKGYHFGASALGVGILLLMVLRYFKGDLFSQDFLFLLMLQGSTASLYQYIKIKNSLYLVTFILSLVASVLTLINVLTYYGYF